LDDLLFNRALFSFLKLPKVLNGLANLTTALEFLCLSAMDKIFFAC
jgi:hypothetical protein